MKIELKGKTQLIRILSENKTSIYQNVYYNVRSKAGNLIKNGKRKP